VTPLAIKKHLDIQPPGKILVEREVLNSRLVKNLRENLPEVELEEVERVCEKNGRDPGSLEIVHFRGRFLKSCPGTRHYLCCGYKILHFGVQCSLGCSYCILQAYLNQPNLRIFGNIDDMFEELTAELNGHPHRLFRIGTGEFTDSLLLDPWTRFSRELVPLFSHLPNAVLELKTKTNHVQNLLDLDHGRNTIAAWSLNAEEIAQTQESEAASLDERIHAARQCMDRGYPLAFHFDPMIDFPGWRRGYGEVLDRLFDGINPGSIVWMSLGAFRFMPELKASIRANHPSSIIPYGEFIRGLDGKMRYFRDVRVELYRFMVERIRKVDPGICVYLCMEGKDIWRQVFGYSPEERGGLPSMLNRAVLERMKG
jgi:spore photoproduct lyase